jgi:membrane-bound metal-dependent hydrolase YbcI (DUF457 family)
MDNLTHTIAGFTLSRAWGARSPLETATFLVASNLPDVDVVIEAALGVDRDALLSHRGITHSLVAAPIEVAAIAGVMWAIGGLFGKATGTSSWRRLALLGAVGLAVHLLFDLSNNYGVRILLPFTAEWYAWDLTGLLDPWILIFLALGWFVALIARVHGVEDRRAALVSRLAAACSLALVAGLLGVQWLSHRLALQHMELLAASHRGARVACLPGSISPFRWTAVLDTATRVEFYDIAVPEGVARSRRVFAKDCDKRLEQAARRNLRVQALLSFARFPIFHAEPWRLADGRVGHAVLVEDLRWLAPKGSVLGPSVTVWLDADLRVVREQAHSWR